MPYVVKPHFPDSSLFQNPLENSPDMFLFHRLIISIQK